MQAVFHMDDDTIYALPPRRIAHLLRADEIPMGDVRDHHEVLRRYVRPPKTRRARSWACGGWTTIRWP